MEMTDAPLKPPHDTRLAQPDMTETEIRQWIDACNHEPARRVLRTYLVIKNNDSLAARRLITSEELRTGLVGLVHRLREALGEARSAIAHLEPMALGGQHANHPEEQEWYFRDELLSRIDAALEPPQP